MPKLLKGTDKNYIEMTVDQVGETDLAYRFTDGVVTEWVPKSQLEDMEQASSRSFEIIIPEWLAKEKGFI